MSHNESHEVLKIKTTSSENSNEVIKLLLKELRSWNACSNGMNFAQFLTMFSEKVNNSLSSSTLPYLLEHIKSFAQSEDAKGISASERNMSDTEIDNLVNNCQKNVRKKLKAQGLDPKTIDNECSKPFAILKAELKESSKRQEEVNNRLLEFFITHYEELYNETVDKFEKLLKAKDEEIAKYILETKKRIN